MGKKPSDNSVMDRVRRLFNESGLSLHDLGLKMGYPAESARKSAWQFMKTGDPRVSMIVRFADALGIEAADLLPKSDKSRLK
jgi:transcriptional regulator with XRE-family HTH domain